MANSSAVIKQCLTCPSYGTLALVLVEGQQGADTSVGTGVVRITRGVLGSLAVLSSVPKRAGAGSAARYRYTSQHGHRAVPSIQAVARLTWVLMVAVFTKKAWCTPGHKQKHRKCMLSKKTNMYVPVCVRDKQTKQYTEFQSGARNAPHQTTVLIAERSTCTRVL